MDPKRYRFSLSLFFFLREECDRFRDEDRSGGIMEDEIEANFISKKGYFGDIEKFHNNVGRKIRV